MSQFFISWRTFFMRTGKMWMLKLCFFTGDYISFRFKNIDNFTTKLITLQSQLKRHWFLIKQVLFWHVYSNYRKLWHQCQTNSKLYIFQFSFTVNYSFMFLTDDILKLKIRARLRVWRPIEKTAYQGEIFPRLSDECHGSGKS